MLGPTKFETSYNAGMTRRTRPVDDLVWVEGHLRDRKPGIPSWSCVYCYHAADVAKAHAVINRLCQMKSLGQRLPEELDKTFDDFRIKMPGEVSDADNDIDNIRNTLGGWALIKMLALLGGRCDKIDLRTGGICMKPPKHDGKHSASI